MSVRLDHVGLWVRDLDAVAAFYARYFDASIGALYQNPRKGFESRFLQFTGGARLEVMRRDRKFGDDLGRRTLMQAFDVLGEQHPLVIQYRRRVASLLH